MVNAIDELGKYTPMESHRSYPVVLVTPERIAALEAENRRLRKALRSIFNRGAEAIRVDSPANTHNKMVLMYAIARDELGETDAALEPSP